MLYRPPDIFPYPLSHCLPDLLVFIHPTHYYDFLAYNRLPATQPLHYWYHNLVSSELLISIIYFTFICIHDYRLLIKQFPLSISKKRIYVRRTQLASGWVVSALCILCALTVRRTFFLIPCAQQRFSYSDCARRPLVQPKRGRIQPVHPEDMLGPRSTGRDLMNYPCWESAPWVTSISSSDILYHHLNSQLCRPRSPEDTAY